MWRCNNSWYDQYPFWLHGFSFIYLKWLVQEFLVSPCIVVPAGSIYGIFNYIWLILVVNVGKWYTIHDTCILRILLKHYWNHFQQFTVVMSYSLTDLLANSDRIRAHLFAPHSLSSPDNVAGTGADASVGCYILQPFNETFSYHSLTRWAQKPGLSRGP